MFCNLSCKNMYGPQKKTLYPLNNFYWIQAYTTLPTEAPFEGGKKDNSSTMEAFINYVLKQMRKDNSVHNYYYKLNKFSTKDIRQQYKLSTSVHLDM